MSRDPAPDSPKKAAGKPRDAGREDRLKAALKANMARRKGQVKARARKSAGADSKPEGK